MTPFANGATIGMGCGKIASIEQQFPRPTLVGKAIFTALANWVRADSW